MSGIEKSLATEDDIDWRLGSFQDSGVMSDLMLLETLPPGCGDDNGR